MGLIQLIVIVIGGLLAVPSLLANNPKAEEFFKKIKPSQGYIGVLLVIWGLIDLVLMFVYLRVYFASVVYGITQLLAVVVEILLGFLLSSNLIKTIKNIPANKIETIESKIVPYQGPIGIVAVFIGILRFVFYVISGLMG